MLILPGPCHLFGGVQSKKEDKISTPRNWDTKYLRVSYRAGISTSFGGSLIFERVIYHISLYLEKMWI